MMMKGKEAFERRQKFSKNENCQGCCGYTHAGTKKCDGCGVQIQIDKDDKERGYLK